MRALLLPGLHGTRDGYETFLGTPPPGWSVEALEYPRERVLGYEALADELRPAVTAIAPEVLIGESFGGPLALRLAADGLAGLRAVALVASFVLPPRPGVARWLPWQTGIRLGLGPFYWLRQTVARRADEREASRRMEIAMRSVPPAVLAARVRATLAVDARALLAACPAPVLAVTARRDWLISRRSPGQMRAQRPDMAQSTVDAAHRVLFTVPAAAWAAVREFTESAAVGQMG